MAVTNTLDLSAGLNVVKLFWHDLRLNSRNLRIYAKFVRKLRSKMLIILNPKNNFNSLSLIKNELKNILKINRNVKINYILEIMFNSSFSQIMICMKILKCLEKNKLK